LIFIKALQHTCRSQVTGDFLCDSYAPKEPSGSISYERSALYASKKEGVLLDLLLIGGALVLICLFIAYEHLCRRV
jgi:hypothetical protein